MAAYQPGAVLVSQPHARQFECFEHDAFVEARSLEARVRRHSSCESGPPRLVPPHVGESDGGDDLWVVKYVEAAVSVPGLPVNEHNFAVWPPDQVPRVEIAVVQDKRGREGCAQGAGDAGELGC